MNDPGPTATPDPQFPGLTPDKSSASDEPSSYDRIIPRVLRIMLVVSVLLLAPAFWFYGWAGLLGLACGAAVSYINFRVLKRGVEGLADRVVNRSSREKGGWVLFRFLVRYGLVGAAAYAIFKSSSAAFPRFSLGLMCAGCGPDDRGWVGGL